MIFQKNKQRQLSRGLNATSKAMIYNTNLRLPFYEWGRNFSWRILRVFLMFFAAWPILSSVIPRMLENSDFGHHESEHDPYSWNRK